MFHYFVLAGFLFVLVLLKMSNALYFQAALNTDDPQYQDKRMVAQRNGKLSVQVFNVRILQFFLVMINCMVIFHYFFNVSMLQVCVGKEKEAISDMLPYLRLGYVSDPSEMQSVISSQGPVCPVSLSYYENFYFELYAFM